MMGEQTAKALEAELDAAARVMPDGLRDLVCAYAMRAVATDRRSEAGQQMSAMLGNAAQGTPNNPEQEARWKRLGLID